MDNIFLDNYNYYDFPPKNEYDWLEKEGIQACYTDMEKGQKCFLECAQKGTRFGYYLYALTFKSKADMEKYMNLSIEKAGGYAYMALGRLSWGDPWLSGEYVAKALTGDYGKCEKCVLDYSKYSHRWFLDIYEDGDIKFADELVVIPELEQAIKQDPSPSHIEDCKANIQRAQVRNIWRRAAVCPKCGSPRGEFSQKKERGKKAIIGTAIGLLGGPAGMILGASIGAATAKNADFCTCPQCGNTWKTKVDHAAIDRIVNG